MKINSSAKMNKDFANKVSFMSIDCGVELHVARNIMRFRRNLKTAKKVWTDPKTGLPLTVEQWTGPALKRANKIKNGTATKLDMSESPYLDDHFGVEQNPDATWLDATECGMVYLKPDCVLMSKEGFSEFMMPDAENPFDHEISNEA